MRTAERIDTINRCALALAGRGWSEIDFLLEQFGLPTSDRWSGSGPDAERDYTRSMLGVDPGRLDAQLLELDEYLQRGSDSHSTEDEPWSRNTFCVFITHLADHRAQAEGLKAALADWGIAGFVAHADIHPGKQWVRVIVAALNSCDALVALLHEGIKNSDWCDQEMGVCLGRGVPVVPIQVDVVPYGLAGLVQAIPWRNKALHPAKDCAYDIVSTLLNDKRSSLKVLEALILGLENAPSYEAANQIADFLVAHTDGSVTQAHIDRLKVARSTNPQVSRAFYVPRAIRSLERKLPKTEAASYGYSEEPF
jgi:hypothetical protein